MSSSKKTSIHNLLYNYNDVTIYANQYEKTLKNGGYIKLPFSSYKSIINPNIILFPSQNKYKTENMYIIKKTHNINSVNYDGELIIEHSPITNGDRIYTCFLLKTQPGYSEESIVDKIIRQTFTSTLVVNLNPFLLTNKTCQVNSDNTFFIFTSPILVTSRFDDFDEVNPDIFPDITSYSTINPYITIQQQSITEGFTLEHTQTGANKENVDTEDMVITCSPIESSEEQIEMITLTPVGSALSNNAGLSQFINTSANFFSFFVLLCIAVFVTPMVYKAVCVNLINKLIKTENDKQGNLKFIDFLFIGVLLAYSIYTVSTGISNKDSLFTGIGVIFFIFIFLSIGRIVLLKQSDPENYNFGMATGDNPVKFGILNIFITMIQKQPATFLGIFGITLFLSTFGSYLGWFLNKAGGGDWDLKFSSNLAGLLAPIALFFALYICLLFYKP